MSSNKTLHIEGFALSEDGRTMARVTGPEPADIGRVVFCQGLLPGESAIATLDDDRGKIPQVRVVDITHPGAERVSSFCPVFGKCGGCTVQELSYPALAEEKTRHVRDCLTRIGKIPADTVLERMAPMLVAGNPVQYRNHMQYHRDVKAPKNSVRFGLYASRSHEVVLHETCAIAHPAIDRARKAVERFFDVFPQVLVDEHREPDSLVVRAGTQTRQLAYAIKNAAGIRCRYEGLDEYIEHALREQKLPFEVNQTQITERIGDRTFRVSIDSFFQVNTAQADALYRRIKEVLPDDAKDHTLLDLYCGTGSIGLFLADRVREVVGIEIYKKAIENARDNAKMNDITNARFFVQPAERFDYARLNIARPSIVVLDPPRQGCAPELIEKVKTLLPAHIIYVSCNPATLARDLRAFIQDCYTIGSVTPVDMFPWTGHVETVVAMSRDKK